MFKRLALFLVIISLSACFDRDAQVSENGHHVNNGQAPKPLYTDPIYNGAADPTVVWNEKEKKWFMFYTNRRANVEGLIAVEWVHGTPIGIAESNDGGKSWQYREDAKINYPRLKNPDLATYWAPDVFEKSGVYHMYLTIVPGVFDSWSHPRSIAHFTSKNLIEWNYISTLNLSSERVIDADVIALPRGGYRMFYNNEPDDKSVYFADSPDLYHWTDKGKAALNARGEGPVTFFWKGYWWLIIDVWKGLNVYRSSDLEHWELQAERLLEKPGVGKDDGVIGGHPDVIVNSDRAYLFYFTHPGRTPDDNQIDNESTRRSVIQVTELFFQDGLLACNRDSQTFIDLQ